MVVYESFMYGTPVLGADIGGIPELIEEGATGYLFKPEDAESLSAQLKRARNEYSSAMFERVRRQGERLTLDNHIDELVSVYHGEIA